jgi:hypothetical protein
MLLTVACISSASARLGVAEADDCASSQLFPYAAPHLASHWKQFESDLTPTQQQVLVAVLQGQDQKGRDNDSTNEQTLYFALPGGVLTVWFGESNNPTGEFPVSLNRCGGGITAACRMSYPVVGSANIYYFPSSAGGPAGSAQEGVRWYQTVTEEVRQIDRVARSAYAKYIVPSPWARGIKYFERPC